MIDENIFDAREELKRVDHLIFVSLKYTRTCDVMKSIIERLISAHDFIFKALLEKLKKEKKIEEIPKLPAPRVNTLKEYYTDEYIIKEIEFYMLLRRLNRVDNFTRVQEYRRNVTMILPVDGRVCEITIDSITEYYKEAMGFLERIYETYYKEEED